MREHQRRDREMFVPLHHTPGHAQADFGEALVVIGGVEKKAHFLVMDLPDSDACYVRAYPAATEAWADGLVHAFAFFGRVPLSVLSDNDGCLVARILPDETRKRPALFSGLLSHYVIEDRYGRPGKGNDTDEIEQPSSAFSCYFPCAGDRVVKAGVRGSSPGAQLDHCRSSFAAPAPRLGPVFQPKVILRQAVSARSAKARFASLRWGSCSHRMRRAGTVGRAARPRVPVHASCAPSRPAGPG